MRTAKQWARIRRTRTEQDEPVAPAVHRRPSAPSRASARPIRDVAPRDIPLLQHGAGNRAAARAALRGPARGTVGVTRFVSPEVRRQVDLLAFRWHHRLPDRVRRISIPRTVTADADWQRVPDDHLARVQAGVRIITDRLTSRPLINYFRDHAPGGTVNTLQQVANRARVWELRRAGSMGLSETGGSNMAYDTNIYRIGRYQIAATLLHEMGHLARFPTEAECENAMDAAGTYAPLIRSIQPRSGAPGTEVTIRGISFGPAQEATDRVTLNGVDVGRVLAWRWQHAGQGLIRFRVPEGSTGGPLVVENNRVPSAPIPFEVTAGAAAHEEPPAAAAAGPPVPAPAALGPALEP